jgi:hypothetical protein
LGLAVYNSIYEMKMEWKPVMAKPKGRQFKKIMDPFPFLAATLLTLVLSL